MVKPTQEQLFDRWTLPHVVVGSAFSLLGFNWKTALLLSASWEIFENSYLIPNTHWHYESKQNQIGDILANMAGFVITNSLKNRS